MTCDARKNTLVRRPIFILLKFKNEFLQSDPCLHGVCRGRILFKYAKRGFYYRDCIADRSNSCGGEKYDKQSFTHPVSKSGYVQQYQ